MKKRARGPTRVREEGGGGGKWQKKMEKPKGANTGKKDS